MNDVTTEVRGTFAEVADAVAVPPFDEVAFRARVRAGRRSRRSTLAVAAAASVALAAASAYAVVGLAGDHEDGGPPVAGDAHDRLAGLPGPVYFRDPSNLKAVTPDGTLHDLDVATDTIIGATSEFVLAQDDHGRIVQVDVASSGEGDGRFTFTRGASPVPGRVGWAVLSGDGRYLAWKQSTVVRVLDLKAATEVASYPVAEDGRVSGVAERTVLVGGPDGLVLHTPEGEVEVPWTDEQGLVASGDLQGDLVSVPDRDDTTKVYDVSGGTAELVEELPGTGRLAPYGRGVVTRVGREVRLWRDGRTTTLGGVRGAVQEVGWWDEDNALVISADLATDGSTIYLCPVTAERCSEVLESPSGDVSLP